MATVGRLEWLVMNRLDEVDLTLRMSREDEERRLSAAQRRLLHLRLWMAGLLDGGGIGPPLCVLFEGWDASGKGGAVKRLVAHLDPRHVRVAQFGVPTHDEKRHHFLTRFAVQLPGWGGMAVFDRSWYGRVLVERVEGFATEEQWQRGYDEIVQYERTLAQEGMVLVKLWMHISKAEQKRRFEARQHDPLKQWKLTEEDWRNRKKWPAYEAAVRDMLDRTDHPLAPWDVIPAENKRYARVAVVETVIRRTEEGLRRQGFEVPPSAGMDFDAP